MYQSQMYDIQKPENKSRAIQAFSRSSFWEGIAGRYLWLSVKSTRKYTFYKFVQSVVKKNISKFHWVSCVKASQSIQVF